MATEIEKQTLHDDDTKGVRYVEVVHHYDDEEEEIDLVELAKYIWSKKAVVLGATVICTAAAALYAFAIAKPVYGYTALLRVPTYNGMQLNTCMETLKNDVGKINDGAGNALSGVAIVKGSSVLKLDFSGSDPAKVKAVADKYLPKAQQEAYKIVSETEEQRYTKSVIDVINRHIDSIESRLMDAHYSEKDALSLLQGLKERVNEQEQQKIVLQPEFLSAPKTASQIGPNKKKFLGIGFAAGLFLGLGYAVVKFLVQGSTKK